MHAQPTGQLRGARHVSWSRTLPVSVAHLWHAVIDPNQMRRWIGTWSGDPASGHVRWIMTAEGDETGNEVEVLRCEPLRVVEVQTPPEAMGWHLALEFSGDDDSATVTLVQPIDDPATLEMIGPGWDYYLDALVCVERWGDVASLDFERDYYPAQGAYYRDLAAGLVSAAS